MLVVTSWSACLDGDFDGKIGCVLISDSVKPQVACHAHDLSNLCWGRLFQPFPLKVPLS